MGRHEQRKFAVLVTFCGAGGFAKELRNPVT